MAAQFEGLRDKPRSGTTRALGWRYGLAIAAGVATGVLAATLVAPGRAGACSCYDDEPDLFELRLVSVTSSDGLDEHAERWPAEAFIDFRELGVAGPGFRGLDESPGVVHEFGLGAAR